MFGRLASAFVGIILLASLATSAAAGDHAHRYGKGVSNPDDVVAISQLLADPEKYLDQTVRVSGSVVGVCKKRGCWMELASDEEFQTLQIKVEDGEIVFPMEIMGETAIAEGVFTGIPMTLEQTCNYLEHEATCQGQEFDRDSIKEAMTFYRIQGTGALVTPAQAEKATADAPSESAS